MRWCSIIDKYQVCSHQRHQHLVQVYLVLEEDGTEVDDEEYFQTLPDNTMFMLLFMQVCFCL